MSKLVKLKTLQDKRVLDKLKNGEDYIASYSNIFNKNYIDLYKRLSSICGFKNCPIFCVPANNMSAIDSTFTHKDQKDKVMISLNVPVEYTHAMEYYT